MERKKYLPLTLQQRDIWIDQKINPGNSSYNIGASVRISGPFDRNLVAQTIQHLIRNNDALRLAFVEKNGQPYQFFHEIFNIRFPYYDFSNKDSPAEDCLAWIRSDFNEPFHRMDQPLVEWTLLKAADTLFFLYTKQHHLITDGYGFGLQARQLVHIYNKLLREATFESDENFSFRTQIVNNKNYAHSDQYIIDEAFWKERFPDVPDPILFHSSAQSPDHNHVKSRRKSIQVSSQEYKLFKQMLKEKRVPRFAFLLGILFCFLYRLTGKKDISLGVPLFNRPYRKAFKTIGLYMGVMPFRTTINPNIPFLEFVSNLNSELKNCISHSRYPIGDINRLSGKQPNQRLYNICFSYDRSASTYSFHNCDTTMNWIKPYSQADNLLLTVKENSLHRFTEILIDYQEDVFDSHFPISNIVTLSRSFISEVLANLNKKLCDYEILNVQERERILRGFNCTALECPINETVINLLERRAVQNPLKIAVVYDDVQITYKDLNRKSNQLANHLINRNEVKTNDRVAILLRRSEKMVIAIWGILKSGAAYIPIDPDYPVERIQYMLKDSNPKAIVTETDLVSEIGIDKFTYFIDMGIKFSDNDCNPNVTINADDLAYIIYTSGTTGKPKGAMNTHKGIFNRIYWMQEEYRLTPSDKVIQKTPFSFDVSVWEFLWPLMFGACLVVAKPDGHKDPEYLKEMIIAHKITTIHFVPSMLQEFLKSDSIELCNSLLRVFCSGEALSTNIRDRFFLRLGAELHNLYGPTEAAIDVTAWDCREATDCKSIPIGKPIANMEIYIVDEQMRLVPQGLSGEICIGGVGVASGYWSKPELTREKFVDNPYRSNEKMYRTGDLGRWLIDGNIEFLGRMDDQVKIRGLRIEPKEIENVLLLHEAIDDAVVVGEKISTETHVLAAYLITRSKLNFMDLRQAMGIHLPDYMIPSFFVEIDRIPLSPNGKLDKKQLPDPLLNSIDMCQDYVAPTNETETVLVGIWQEVLGIQPIGIHHDFFSLGGDSIRVIEIVRMANYRLIKITVADILKHRTISQIVQVVTNRLNDTICGLDDENNFLDLDLELLKVPEYAPIKVPKEMIATCLPLSRMQDFMIREYASWHTPGQVYHFQETIRIKDHSFSKAALIDALYELVKKHSVLRTVFIVENDMAVCQVVRRNIDHVITFKDIQNLSKDNQSDCIAIAMDQDRKCPFDLSDQEKPLFRFNVFIKSDSEVEWMLSFHHAIMDGWSNINLLIDLFDYYLKFKKGEPIQVNKNSNRSYAQLIVLEKKSIASTEAQSFWKQQLGGCNPANLFPKSNRQQKLQNKNTAIHIDNDYVNELQNHASRHQLNLKALFLSAYFDALCEQENVQSLTIGCVTNRRSEHLHQPLDATGLFWNILPIHMHIIKDKLAQANIVHQILIDIQPYVLYPLPQIIDDHENSDLFFSTFNYVRFNRGKFLSQSPDLQILAFDFFDKFHFPLNLLVAFHPVQTDLVVKLEFDDRYFSAVQIQDILYKFRSWLDHYL